MVAGDLILGSANSAPVGFGNGVDITEPADPADILTITSSSQAASVWSALAAGGVRIKQSSGVTLTRTNGQGELLVGANVQWYCPSGTATVDLTAITAGLEIFRFRAVNDHFLGNLRVLLGPGDGTANNGHAWHSWEHGSLRMYCFHVETVVFSPAPSAKPENYIWWRNTGDNSTDLATLQGCKNDGNGAAGAKWFGLADNHDLVDQNTARVTFYRSTSDGSQRSPMQGGATIVDYCNNVWPTHSANEFVRLRDYCVADFRGNAFGNNTGGEEFDLGSAINLNFYLPLSGDGEGDATNFEYDGPTLPTTSGAGYTLSKTTEQVTKTYTLAPTAMDATERDAVLAEAGPGVFAITEEAPPTVLDPNTQAVIVHDAIRERFGREYAPIITDPIERRAMDAVPTTFPTRIGRGLRSFDRFWNHAGLYVPWRTDLGRHTFALGGV